ncbi:unnamed protein product [Porites evermanni]|uniref:SOCS box domain-containing protein n=1 Tax=Porites evermanni TaxID=104178 RepID=A0ABN8Q0F7_9CNID|nr:unnamed protein product [Porites evermanni]
MKVLANNCVSTVKIPEGVNSGNDVSYNPVLGLFVTVDFYEGISVWNHVSGEVMAECDLPSDFKVSLLPGNRVALSYQSGSYYEGSVEIYSLEKDTFDFFELELKMPSSTDPGVIALTPQKSLLVASSVQLDPVLYEIFMDWNNLKVVKMREIVVPLPEEEDEEYNEIGLLCYSPDGKVIRAEYEVGQYEALSSLIKIAKISLSCEKQFKMQDEATVSYYILDGEGNQIDNLRGFIHDGQNLIIAEGEKIVLLESLTEGSNAQLIVSGLKPAEEDSRKVLGMNLNHKGQLMVCDDKEFIKVFEYRCRLRSLQDICRCFIVDTIHTGYSHKVKSLAIPSTLKDYLLYNSSARSGRRDLNKKKTSQKSESSYSLTSGELSDSGSLCKLSPVSSPFVFVFALSQF